MGWRRHAHSDTPAHGRHPMTPHMPGVRCRARCDANCRRDLRAISAGHTHAKDGFYTVVVRANDVGTKQAVRVGSPAIPACRSRGDAPRGLPPSGALPPNSRVGTRPRDRLRFGGAARRGAALVEAALGLAQPAAPAPAPSPARPPAHPPARPSAHPRRGRPRRPRPGSLWRSGRRRGFGAARRARAASCHPPPAPPHPPRPASARSAPRRRPNRPARPRGAGESA